MRKQPVYLASAILLLSLITVTGFKSLPPVSSANGEGELFYNGGAQHFAFHAMRFGDGTVKGSWESRSEGADNRTHGTITCLTIFPDGKTAMMSGVITQKEGTGFPWFTVGDPIWFKVQDNGEGARSSGDKFSDYYMGLSGCVDYGISLLPIENGNIQVKP